MRNYQYNNLTIEQFNNRKGITLIELVMVIVIVGILAAVSSLYIKETIGLWRFLTFRNEVVSGGRMALARMAREIRQMTLRTPAFEPIETADSSRLRFTIVDLNGDTYADTVEFYLNSNELRRILILRDANGNATSTSDNVLASGVQSLKFCYYKKDNNAVCSPLCECDVPSADLSGVYRINIELEIKSGDQTKTLKSQIFPRNLGG